MNIWCRQAAFTKYGDNRFRDLSMSYQLNHNLSGWSDGGPDKRFPVTQLPNGLENEIHLGNVGHRQVS